jgi:ElaB/YqjD/DUF883 family membrane-anchored ribosome-binding protein
MKRVFLAVILATLLTLCAIAVAPAQVRRQSREEGPLKKRVQERWEFIRERMELVVTRYENNYQRHAEVFSKLKERLASALDALEKRGYDVSALREDMATLESMLKEFDSDYSDLMGKLKEILALSADQAAQSFLGLLGEARELLREVRKDILDIRLFCQDEIRTDLQELSRKAG